MAYSNVRSTSIPLSPSEAEAFKAYWEGVELQAAYMLGQDARRDGKPYLDYLNEGPADKQEQWKQGWKDEDFALRTGSE